MSVTRAGFLAFIRSQMGINSTVLPDNSLDIDNSLAIAQEIVNPVFEGISPLIFELATYNLAGDTLINIANDQTGQTYFADLRDKFKIFAFTAGVVASAYDESTGESLAVSDALKNLTLADLQNLKTPYGRQYLAFAMRWGTNWGIS